MRPPADLPLRDVVDRVYRNTRPRLSPGAASIHDVNIAIRDAVVLKRLHSWGSVGDMAPKYIHVTKWKRATLDCQTGELRVHEKDGAMTLHKGLIFNKAEVEQAWPEPFGPDEPFWDMTRTDFWNNPKLWWGIDPHSTWCWARETMQ